MDPEAFSKLALAEMDAIYRLAYHLAQHSQEADDLVQETYLRAFKSAAGFRPNEHGIRPWLFKILHNVLNTRLSQEHRQRELVEGLHHEPAPAPSGGDDAPPSVRTIDWDNVDQRLKAAIQDLSLPHRAVFLLCAVEGLSYGEVAEVTEVPVGTVMSRLYRARAILAERLADLAAERGIGRQKTEKKVSNREIGGTS